MKNKTTIALLMLLTGSHAVWAGVTEKKQDINPLANKSIKDYKVCDVQELAQELGAKYSVVHLIDEIAQYNYYMVRNTSDLNADPIRKDTCEFIIKNKCYLYWGNVVNLAMISAQKAAWFPADTSPHYMLSPDITCNKIKHHNK